MDRNKMNPRIKEIEFECYNKVRCGLNGTSVSDVFDKKKFADLIVDECAALAAEYWNDAGLQKAFSIDEYIFANMGD